MSCHLAISACKCFFGKSVASMRWPSKTTQQDHPTRPRHNRSSPGDASISSYRRVNTPRTRSAFAASSTPSVCMTIPAGRGERVALRFGGRAVGHARRDRIRPRDRGRCEREAAAGRGRWRADLGQGAGRDPSGGGPHGGEAEGGVSEDGNDPPLKPDIVQPGGGRRQSPPVPDDLLQVVGRLPQQ